MSHLQRLQGLLDNATAGAIVFSLGSLMMPSEMPLRVQAAFMAAFRELAPMGYSVVARWSEKPPPLDIPENVHLETSWMPQDDLLGERGSALTRAMIPESRSYRPRVLTTRARGSFLVQPLMVI